MKYLKVEKDQIIKYPYSIEDLKKDNPKTLFIDNINKEVLESFNVKEVIEVQKQEDYTKNYTEGVPENIDGIFYQNWIESDAKSEEIQERINSKWESIRQIRNSFLSECDWTQLRDAPFNESKRAEWVKYRQDLRDITKQPDPFKILWPVKPQ